MGGYQVKHLSLSTKRLCIQMSSLTPLFSSMKSSSSVILFKPQCGCCEKSRRVGIIFYVVCRLKCHHHYHYCHHLHHPCGPDNLIVIIIVAICHHCHCLWESLSSAFSLSSLSSYLSSPSSSSSSSSEGKAHHCWV